MKERVPCVERCGERWRAIEGYGGEYQVSDFGRVRYKRAGKWYEMQPCIHADGSYRVNLTVEKNVHRYRTVWLHSLVMRAFRGETPEGMRILHINGIKTDCKLSNLRFAPIKEAASHGGRTARKRCVLKVGRNGEIMDVYRTSGEAGAANNICYHAVIERCNGHLKNPFDLLGYSFRWEI